MDENFDIRTALDEMRQVLSRTHAGLDSAKATARSVLSAASLVVSLLGVLQLIGARIASGNETTFTLGLLAGMGLYTGLIALCVYVLGPTVMFAPIDSNWNELRDAFVGKTEREILKQQLADTLGAITLNERVVARRWKAVAIASGLLPAVVVLLLLLGTLPRV